MTLIQANKSHTSLLNSCRLNCPGTPLFCHARGGCSPRPRHQSRTLVRSSKDGEEEEEGSRKGNFGDEMLDFMYAGKKLRKWYGEEGMVLPRDGGDQPNNSNNRGDDDEVGDGSVRDTILVLEADSVAMAEQVLLQLILRRANVKAIVRDAQAAQAGFGSYVDVVGGNVADGALLRKACRGVASLVICGEVSQYLIAAAESASVPSIVLLSAVGATSGRTGFSLFGSGREMAVLENAKREELVMRSGIPYTIVRIGKLTDSAGGVSRLKAEAKGSSSVGGVISREDAALVLAQAAARDVEKQGSLVLSVAAQGESGDEPPEDWQRVFEELAAQTAAAS